MSAFPANTLITEFFALITGATPHLALYTSNPTASNTGTEVTGGSYARPAITFGAVSGGSIANTGTVTFTSLTFNIITHWGIFDAATSGHLLAYGELTTEVVTDSGEGVTIGVGDIVLDLLGS